MNYKEKIKEKDVFKIILAIIVSALFLSSTAMAGITVNANRLVVLDDPNDGSAQTDKGFFNPSVLKGGSWNSNYWNGESTKIKAVAVVIDGNGSPMQGTNVTFTLKNPAGISKNTASSITDNHGISYYSFDLNEQRYWGYWRIDVSANIDGSNVVNSTSFVMNFWGCNQCHGGENPGNWGAIYTPKSYYTIGYSFHKSQNKAKHTEAMYKGNCIICHQSYNGTPINWKFNDNAPTLYNDNEYSPDWHKGKATCQDCHEGSNRSTTPQGKNPEIAGCYDTAGCHPKKNINVEEINSTTGYILGSNYRTNYSNIPNNISKAHSKTGITCIACHGAGHNLSKPFNAPISSNNYTENEQCWQCHTTRSNHFGQSCINCHSQNTHNVSNPHSSLSSKTEEVCRTCHGNTPDRHHYLVANGTYQCKDCHPVVYNSTTQSYTTQIIRDCLVCHRF